MLKIFSNCSLFYNSLSENDLLVNCMWLINNLLAELVERSGNCLILTGAELLSSLNLVHSGGSTLHAQENLWQILRLSVGDGPLVLLRFECWDFLDFFSLRWLLTFSWCLWFGNRLRFWEFLPLDVSFLDNFWLVSELEANDSLDTSNIFLNIDELVHES